MGNHVLHPGGDFGEVLFGQLIPRIHHQVQERLRIHGAPDHLPVALARHLPHLIESILVGPETQDLRHLCRADSIPFPQGDDFVRVRNPMPFPILVRHLIETDCITLRRRELLPRLLVTESDMYIRIPLPAHLPRVRLIHHPHGLARIWTVEGHGYQVLNGYRNHIHFILSAQR